MSETLVRNDGENTISPQSDTDIPVCDSPKSDTDIPVCDSAPDPLKGETQAGMPVLPCSPQAGMPVLPCSPQAGMPVSPSPNPLTITQRNLPHWTMDGCIYWINFRLADALPQEKLRVWKEECDAWLKHHPKPWIESVWKKYDERFGDRLERWLDAGLGSRALARPDVREAVKECLMRFDGERLRVHSVVIMPTHVHLLLEPLRDNKLPLLLKGIKGASARRANQILGTSGQFWLDESYDHIVRSEEQYGHFLRYIAENPVKAHLRPDEYWHYYNGDTDILVCDPKGEAGIPACAEGNTGIPACGLFSEPTDRNVCATMMKPTDTNVCATMMKPTDKNVCATLGHEMKVASSKEFVGRFRLG